MGASGGNELRATVEIDWAKASAKLQELDRQQKEEDQRASILERRIRRLQEESKNIDQNVARLKSKVGSRIGQAAKSFGKHVVNQIVFDTLSEFSDALPEQIRPVANVAAAGISTLVTTGNPYEAAIAALFQAVHEMRAEQIKYQQQLEALTKDTARRYEETRKIMDKIAEQRIKDQLRLEQELGQIRFDAAKEGNELLQKSWAMTA